MCKFCERNGIDGKYSNHADNTEKDVPPLDKMVDEKKEKVDGTLNDRSSNVHFWNCSCKSRPGSCSSNLSTLSCGSTLRSTNRQICIWPIYIGVSSLECFANALETLSLLTVLVLLNMLVFGFLDLKLPLSILTTLPILWAGFRFRVLTCILCTMFTVFIASESAKAGKGPFIRALESENNSNNGSATVSGLTTAFLILMLVLINAIISIILSCALNNFIELEGELDRRDASRIRALARSVRLMKQIGRELRNKTKEAMRYAKAKSDFLSTMSHE